MWKNLLKNCRKKKKKLTPKSRKNFSLHPKLMKISIESSEKLCFLKRILWTCRKQCQQPWPKIFPTIPELSVWNPKMIKKSTKFFFLKSYFFSQCLQPEKIESSSIFSSFPPVTKNAVLTSLQSFRRWNSNCFQPKYQKCWRINFSRKDSSPQNFPRHVECSIDKLMETLSLIVWTFCSQIQKIVWKSISSSEIFFPLNVSSDKKTQFEQFCRNFSF